MRNALRAINAINGVNLFLYLAEVLNSVLRILRHHGGAIPPGGVSCVDKLAVLSAHLQERRINLVPKSFPKWPCMYVAIIDTWVESIFDLRAESEVNSTYVTCVQTKEQGGGGGEMLCVRHTPKAPGPIRGSGAGLKRMG